MRWASTPGPSATGWTSAGVDPTIYTELVDPATAEETRPYLDYEEDAEPGDVLVYQFATESAVAGWLAGRPEPVIINYHSITPPEFFGPWNNGITRGQVGALAELALLAPRAALGIADSSYIAEELRRAGCPRTTVVPVAGVHRSSPRAESGHRRASAGTPSRVWTPVAVGGSPGTQQGPPSHHRCTVRGPQRG